MVHHVSRDVYMIEGHVLKRYFIFVLVLINVGLLLMITTTSHMETSNR